jgi:asparagine synthase (glutamine-hydrolysing)
MAPTSKNRSTAVIKLIEKLLTKEKVNRLGWIDYEKVAFSKETFIEKGDAAILKDFLIIMSYVVLSERFDVDTAIL